MKRAVSDVASPTAADHEWRLLFVGRMDDLKGGNFLLDALPLAAEELKRTLSLTFAGDGPARASWSAQATALTRRDPHLQVEFVGWLDRDDVDRRMAAADLLVLPSVWPEPFGLVGLEAGHRRLPVAAFDVGGISEWLRPGVNGQLAPGDPPTAAGLAKAIVACLRDRQTHDKLRDGAARWPPSSASTSTFARLWTHSTPPATLPLPDSAATYINRERADPFWNSRWHAPDGFIGETRWYCRCSIGLHTNASPGPSQTSIDF